MDLWVKLDKFLGEKRFYLFSKVILAFQKWGICLHCTTAMIANEGNIIRITKNDIVSLNLKWFLNPSQDILSNVVDYMKQSMELLIGSTLVSYLYIYI